MPVQRRDAGSLLACYSYDIIFATKVSYIRIDMPTSLKGKKISKVATVVRKGADKQAGKQQVAQRPVRVKPASAWTFLTNHAHVLICLAKDPDLRLREVASIVGITERAVQRVVADLEEVGVLGRSKDGRRNRYTVDRARPLRHPIEAHRSVGDLLKLVEGKASSHKQAT
jgi:predicted transcriptional regulator